MLKTIVIEDETYALEHLTQLLTNYCSKKVSIVGIARDMKSAFKTINEHNPELVLMDIRLPDGNSFDLLKKFDEINFNIIFTTAYSEYAIEAFKFSAIHYLLKPIDPIDLNDAIDKAEAELNLHNLNGRINALMYNIQKGTLQEKKIVLTTQKDIYIVNSSEVVLCVSDRNNTEFILVDGRKIQVSKTIKEYEDILAFHGFFRTHRQYLINLQHIKSIERTGTGKVRMKGDIEIPFAVRKKEELLKIVTNINGLI